MSKQCWSIQNFEDQQILFQDFKNLLTTIRNNNPPLLIPARPKFLEEKRKILLKTFELPQIQKICRECRGSCCNLLVNLPPMELADALYIFTDPSFQLPEPDWQFLIQKNKIERKNGSNTPLYCLFSSPQGCRLKNFRPITCLCSTCHKLRETKEIQALLTYPRTHPFYNSPFYDEMHYQLCVWYNKLQEKNINRFASEDIITKILSTDPTCCIHRFFTNF